MRGIQQTFFSNELLIHDKQPLELWHTIQQILLTIIMGLC